MDEEHREIIDLTNTLHEMIRDKKKYAELKNVYELVYTYSRNHFSREEQMLEGVKFPGLAEQKEQHAKFIVRLAEMKDELLSANESVTPEVYFCMIGGCSIS